MSDPIVAKIQTGCAPTKTSYCKTPLTMLRFASIELAIPARRLPSEENRFALDFALSLCE